MYLCAILVRFYQRLEFIFARNHCAQGGGRDGFITMELEEHDMRMIFFSFDWPRNDFHHHVLIKEIPAVLPCAITAKLPQETNSM